jgi:heme exporter protein D
VAGRLSSPRFRRRLLRLGVVLGAASVAAVVSILFWDTGKDYDLPLSNRPAVVYEQPEQVRLPDAERKEAIRTASRFVETAVTRERTQESFELVSEDLRQGLTREEWASGNIPVQPYPVDGARWKLDYQYANEIGLQVYVVPKAGAQLRPMVFLMTMRKGPQGGWLVDSWVPRPGSAGSDSAAPAASSSSGIVPPLQLVENGGKISRVWLAVPIALLSLVFIVPAVVMTRERLRVRRAERAYAAESARRSSSSSSSPS